ncbi:MAG: hypothetical protein WCJ71_00300 [Candidatus Omnitrophota bacterium]
MKTMRWNTILVSGFLLLGVEGVALSAQPVEPLNFQEAGNLQQPAVSVQETQKTQPAVSPASSQPADTLKFLSQNSPLSKTDTNLSVPEVPEGWTRAASNTNYAFQAQLPPHAYDSHTMGLYVMDLRTGESKVVGTYVDATGERGFSFVDVSSKQVSAKPIVIFEVFNPNAKTSVVHFVSLGEAAEPLVLTYRETNVPEDYLKQGHGMLDAVNYAQDGRIAELRLVKADGSTREVDVDLATLQVVPPAGWTRAASNPNYAFQTRYMGTVSLRDYILELKNLVTGETIRLEDRGDYYTRVSYPIYDVSPDGRYVIYGVVEDHQSPSGIFVESFTCIKDMQDPARSLVVNGLAQNIQFNSPTQATLKIDGLDIRINFRNMQVLDPRVISAATRAPLTDFSSYQIIPIPINALGQPGMVANFKQASSGQFSFDYDLGAGDVREPRWVAAMFLFDSYHAFDATTTDFVLEANVTGASYYKLELEDSQGIKTVFRVGVTNGRIQVTKAMIQAVGAPAFDAAHLKAIVMVVDDPHATTGSMAVKTHGLVYQPVISGRAYNPAAVTQLPGNPVLNFGHGSVSGLDNGAIQTVQTSNSKFSFSYTLPDWGNFAFTYLNLNRTLDLSSGITVAVNGPAGTRLKIEFKDPQGGVGVAYLNLTGRMQNYTIPVSELNVDPRSIGQIVFTADEGRMGHSGTVQVEIKGMSYVPVISAVTTAALTDFTRYQITPMAVEPVPGSTAINLGQNGTSQLALNYDLQAGGENGHWAAVMFLFDRFRLFNAKVNDIVLGATVTGASSYKLELEDLNGLKTVFQVTVTNGKIRITNAMIQSAAASGFDASRIKAIVMVINDPNATRGSMIVKTGGMVSRAVFGSYYRRFPFQSWQWWYWYRASRGF